MEYEELLEACNVLFEYVFEHKVEGEVYKDTYVYQFENKGKNLIEFCGGGYYQKLRPLYLWWIKEKDKDNESRNSK